jgi:ribonuclease VapC
LIAIDTSAIVAIMLKEPGADALVVKLETAAARVISHVSILEAIMVLSRSTSQPQAIVDSYLLESAVDAHPFDAAQGEWARHAFLTYGKGRHPAKLNFGDCFSYALAKSLRVPLLYVGGDFAQTDIVSA